MTLIRTTKRPLGFPSIFDDLFSDNIWPAQADRYLRNPSPAVNIKETELGFELEMAAPGFQKEDFQIDLDNNVLTISSRREQKTEQTSKDEKYHRREFYLSEFSRSFSLPEQADVEHINAAYNHGVLKLNIPLKQVTANKKKEIIVG